MKLQGRKPFEAPQRSGKMKLGNVGHKEVGKLIFSLIQLSEICGVGRVMKRAFKGSFIYYVRKLFRKSNISYPLIRTRMCAYQGVGNVTFSENFAYIPNK